MTDPAGVFRPDIEPPIRDVPAAIRSFRGKYSNYVSRRSEYDRFCDQRFSSINGWVASGPDGEFHFHRGTRLCMPLNSWATTPTNSPRRPVEAPQDLPGGSN